MLTHIGDLVLTHIGDLVLTHTGGLVLTHTDVSCLLITINLVHMENETFVL